MAILDHGTAAQLVGTPCNLTAAELAEGDADSLTFATLGHEGPEQILWTKRHPVDPKDVYAALTRWYDPSLQCEQWSPATPGVGPVGGGK